MPTLTMIPGGGEGGMDIYHNYYWIRKRPLLAGGEKEKVIICLFYPISAPFVVKEVKM